MKNRITAFVLCITLCFFVLPTVVFARDTSFETTLAQDLKELGLFYGVSETDFALDRAPTRVEAIIMLIRLLGKSEEATAKKWSHPFEDVPDWADRYIGYAYQNGLTSGTSETTFGTGNAGSQMYLTFVLRALGYSDTINNPDFRWDNPYELSEYLGILPGRVRRNNFLRADVVMVSYAALSVKLKNSNKTLAEKLISEDVFTKKQFHQHYDLESFQAQAANLTELTAEQVYQECSPAVFYLEVYNRKGEAISSGSGFFIDDNGTAVTNYHVIDGAYSAKIEMDNGEAYSVEGVYDYDKAMDWAIIKIDGSGFSELEIGDDETIVGGATVYALGSPLGLQNTISQGLISSTNRSLDGVSYIQTSAAISHGSSGGALINKYGQVIGITSAGFTEGENLGLALPITVIDGYQQSSVIPLSQLTGGGNQMGGNVKASAYDYLSAFVEVYANYVDSEGRKSYKETTNVNGVAIEMGILREEDCLTVYVYEQMGKENFFSSVDITPDKTESFYYHSYTIGNYTACEGYGYLSPASVTRDGILFFQKYEGVAPRQDHEQLFSKNVKLGLDFVNGIFANYLRDFGTFSVYDLGFVNY